MRLCTIGRFDKGKIMLEHFLTKKRSIEAAPPSVDFNGVWKNELDSEMHLIVDGKGLLSGKYKTGVGAPRPTEEFELVGFASGDLISFTANFGDYGSLTAWVGQQAIEGGQEVIKTLWHLERNVPDPAEPENLWGAIITGADTFHR
jgi:hypothetical protein